MIISSELTGKTYETVEECLKEEKEYRKKEAEAEKAKKAKQKALDEAYKEAINACNKYLKLAGVGTVSKVLAKEAASDFDSFFQLFL